MSNIEMLEYLHPEANIPSEPYCGVGALFNADLQTQMNNADRKDWIVISPYRIILRTEVEVTAEDEE